MKKIFLTIATLLFTYNTNSHAEESWKLAKEAEGIKVYTFELPGSPVKSFKGICDIDAPMEVILEVLADIESFPKWFPNCKEYKYIKKDNKDNMVLYMVIKCGWPAADRDVVFFSMHTDAPERGEHLINLIFIKDSDSIVPRNKEYVRMADFGGGYVLKKINKDKTNVSFTSKVDLGGNIPVALVNMLAVDTPFKSLQGLRVMSQKDEYYQKAGIKK